MALMASTTRSRRARNRSRHSPRKSCGPPKAATAAAWLCRDSLPGLAPRYGAGLLADGAGLAAGVRWQLLAFTLLPCAVFIALQRHFVNGILAGSVKG